MIGNFGEPRYEDPSLVKSLHNTKSVAKRSIVLASLIEILLETTIVAIVPQKFKTQLNESSRVLSSIC